MGVDSRRTTAKGTTSYVPEEWEACYDRIKALRENNQCQCCTMGLKISTEDILRQFNEAYKDEDWDDAYLQGLSFCCRSKSLLSGEIPSSRLLPKENPTTLKQRLEIVEKLLITVKLKIEEEEGRRKNQQAIDFFIKNPAEKQFSLELSTDITPSNQRWLRLFGAQVSNFGEPYISGFMLFRWNALTSDPTCIKVHLVDNFCVFNSTISVSHGTIRVRLDVVRFLCGKDSLDLLIQCPLLAATSVVLVSTKHPQIVKKKIVKAFSPEHAKIPKTYHCDVCGKDAQYYCPDCEKMVNYCSSECQVLD